MPHLDMTFLLSQLFWLVAVFLACYFVIIHRLIPSVRAGIEEREMTVNGDLHEAEQLAKQANSIQFEVEKMILKAYSDAAVIRDKSMLQAQAMINKKVDEVNDAFLTSVKAEEVRSIKMRKALEDQLPVIIGDVKSKIISVIMSGYGNL